MSTYKERERSRREGEILLHARRLFREHGFAGLNMDSLAEAVGISKPTLYQHFKNKEDLVAHVILDGMDELEDLLRTTTEDSALERLKLVLRLILVKHYGTDGLFQDIEQDVVSSTMNSHPEVIAAKKRVMAALDRMVDEGKARGEISTDIPTPMTSCLLFKLTGLISAVQARVPPESAADETQDVNAMIEDVIALFERSIARRETVC